MSEQPEEIYLRVETGHPGARSLMVHVTPEFAKGLEQAFAEQNETTVNSNIIELAVPEFLTVAMEIVGPMATVGATLAKVLKEWWHRNDGEKVSFTVNGETISMDGMSVEEMGRVIDLRRNAWDANWREQFPGRFPPPEAEGGSQRSIMPGAPEDE